MNPKTKEITTLGRGGSDLTAVALGVKLGAKDCYIYTDVDGFFTADPRVCLKARSVKNVSWKKSYILACKGAKVLHHRAAFLALKNNLTLYVLNSRNPSGKGTIIQGKKMEDPQTNFITHKENQCYVRITSKDLDCLSFFGRIMSWLRKQDEIPSVSNFELNYVSLIIRSDLVKNLERSLQDRKQDTLVEVLHNNLLFVSLVGEGYLQNPNLVAEVKSIIKVKPVFCDLHESSFSFAVPSINSSVILNGIHNFFVK